MRARVSARRDVTLDQARLELRRPRRFALRAARARDVVRGEALDERTPRHAEQLRGNGLVTRGAREGIDDALALERLDVLLHDVAQGPLALGT